MQITAKGQITIPLEIRQRFGFLPHTEVNFVIKGNHVYLEKAEKKVEHCGRTIIERLRGSATVKMNTDQIMALTRGKK